MRRFYSYLMVMVAFLLCGSKVMAQSITIDGITYTISNGEASATAADKSIVTTEVLSTVEIDGKEFPVRHIAEDAFSKCGGLTSVTLPEGITTIGNSAFLGCALLTPVSFPEGLTTIGNSAFSGCSSLTSVSLPEGVTSIGELAFAGCSSLSSVTLPESLITIGRLAFSGCSSLTSVVLPEGITTIEYGLFSGCPSLTSIVIPESVTSVGDYAFHNCASLTSVTLPEGVTVVGKQSFAGCSSLTQIALYCSMPSASVSDIFGDSDFAPDCTLYVLSKHAGNYNDWISGLAKVDTLTASVTYMVGDEVYFTQEFACGAPLILVDEPTKEGHTFSGWRDVPAIMPFEDITITGTFIPIIYKVTYMVKGEVFQIDSVAYGAVITPPDPVEGVFTGWIGIPATMPARDITIVGDGYRLTYTVDGVIYSDSIYSYGSVITPLAAPVKEGYTFSGWSEIPATMPAEDVAVSGSFSVNSYEVTYIVDGKVYHTDTIAYNTSLTAIAAPVKEGHTFSGWSEMPATMPAKDLIVIGSFKVITYKITYTVDGKEYHTDSIAHGTSLTAIAPPVKEGHTFSGWSEMPATMPAEDVAVSGSFSVNSYEVTYIVDGKVYHTDTIAYTTSLTAIAAPVKEGHTFSGWSEMPTTMPAKDLIVIGSFKVLTYKITYTVDGKEYHTDSIAHGTSLTAIAAPVKEGHTFSGWSEMPATMPAEDVAVSGSFSVNSYKLTYMVDGKVYHTDTIAYGTELTAIAEPVTEGSLFSGWSDIPATMPANDVIVTGSFSVMTYRITYIVDGEVYHTDNVVYGATIPPMAEPAKEGHTFSGWSEIPESMPAEDITVTGSFTVNVYLFTYEVDGEVYHTDSIAYGEPIVPIEQPVKEGYKLSGWVNIPETMPAHDVTISGIFILADRHTDEQGLVYELNASYDAFEVSGYTDDLVPDVVIPTEIYGLPVNAIQPRALAFTINLQSLVIPSTIQSVGKNSLGGNETLLTIEWNTTAPVDAACFSRPSNYGNMLVYVPDATTEVTFQGNVVVDGVIDQLSLVDELPFRNIHAFTARHITYTRNFDKKNTIGVSSGWEGLVIPFDVQKVESKEKGELKPFGEADFVTSLPYWLGELQPDGTFAITKGITANKPFIMQLPNSDEYEDRYNVEGDVTFSAENVTVHTTLDIEKPNGEGYTLLGSYEGTPAGSHVYALNEEEYTADNDTYLLGGIFVNNSRDIRPFEAYVYNINATSATYLRISEHVGTSIKLSTVNGQQSTEIYDLMGRKVLNIENMKSGVYIVNGNKMIK